MRKDILNDYENRCRFKELSENTIISYNKTIKMFLDFCNINEYEDLMSVTEDDVINFINKLEDDGLSPTSLNTKKRHLVAFNKYTMAKKHIPNGFALDIPNKKTKSKTVVYLTEEQQSKIASAIRAGRGKEVEKDILLFKTLLLIGARRAEVAKLEISDIDIENSKILLDGKGEKARLVDVNTDFLHDLVNYYHSTKSYNHTNYIFVTRTGRPYIDQLNVINVKFDKWLRWAGINKQANKDTTFSPHKARHSLANGLRNSGEDMASIADVLGHSSIETTKHYLGRNNTTMANTLQNNKLVGG